MMGEKEFHNLVERIIALGHDRDDAEDYAAWIGDTPVLDADGLVIVRDETGTIVARLKLDF